jgi:CRISPR/Cas system CMR subunit Cmr4 (Cas7 group RAMP superfamily)
MSIPNPEPVTGEYLLSHEQSVAISQRALLEARTMKARQEENLHDPAWQASITTLENAWLAKFGNEWVDGALLVNDGFFSVAAERLVPANKLERHLLMSRDYPVYRIVE